MKELNYEYVFNTLVVETSTYCKENNIKSLVLGISGGIDSTVVAAIAREVCDRDPDIKFITASLPIKNETIEYDVSVKVGESFCPEGFEKDNLLEMYNTVSSILLDNKIKRMERFGKTFDISDIRTLISEGNLQARLRMMYLYDLASITNGMVLSTDNQTEYQLGFWTIHGDIGDYDPIQALWKTEVYKLAKWIVEDYSDQMIVMGTNFPGCYQYEEQMNNLEARMNALKESISLIPTDGLGISSSDLEQIGAKSYQEVDDILDILLNKSEITVMGQTINVFDMNKKTLATKYGSDVVEKIWSRHIKSEFKRKRSPISIPRKLLV